MRKSIQSTALIAVVLSVVCLITPESVVAQAVEVLQRKTGHGRSVQTPYIAYNDFQKVSSSIARKKTASKSSGDTTGGSLREQVALRTLLSVSSLDELIRTLGEPKALDRDKFSDGSWAITLEYEGGTMFDYHKFEDGKIALIELQLWRSNESLKVGGAELRPGMSIDSLSPAVRQSITKGYYPKGANVDGIGVIHIAKPGSEQDGEVEFLQDGKAQITVHVNRRKGTVEVVRFTRLGPW